MKISEMTNKELAEEYEAICDTIDNTGCFGTRDLRWRGALEHEINKRELEVTTVTKVRVEVD